jgi:glycosyltransferase involved in cell wall biosynthesis
MKILLYNWVNHDDEEGRGGGVRLYQHSLIAELAKDPEYQVYTLSSGIHYDLLNRRTYIRARPRKNRVAGFEVVNSPVAAPAHAIFHSLDVYLHDTTLKTLIGDFLEIYGPFDVVQLDNLEGLSAGVLELKERFPMTRFIYYLHNYNLFCPQVNLWFAESRSCDDYNEGKRCPACLPHAIDLREVKIAHAIAGLLKRLKIKPQSVLFRLTYRNLALTKRVLRLIRRAAGLLRPDRSPLQGPAPPKDGARPLPHSLYHARSAGRSYWEYRVRNLAIVNRHFDHILAVSQRVREVAVRHGVAHGKVRVLYIGSRFAELRRPIRFKDRGPLKIAYLGYERKDKGFYHFVETLEAMPRSLARQMSVLIAARIRTPGLLERLKRLGAEFLDLQVVDGYDHQTLPRLLEDVDLGIVPVLWEDNLPQVAIELVAHGVPVLSSDLGGAKELCGANPRFVYRHGNANDLISKILFFVDNRRALATYNDRGLELMDMRRHLEILRSHYYGIGGHAPPQPRVCPSSEPACSTT